MPRFALRFCVFYALFLTAWELVRPYHDALLISLVITAGQVFTTLPPILPELLDDSSFHLHLGQIWVHLTPSGLTSNTPVFAALMMATSALPTMSRMKTTARGIGVLLCAQVLSALFLIYDQLHRAYFTAIRKGIEMREIFEYNPANSGLVTVLKHMALASDFLLPLCLWVVLAYWLKRESAQTFPLALL